MILSEQEPRLYDEVHFAARDAGAGATASSNIVRVTQRETKMLDPVAPGER